MLFHLVSYFDSNMNDREAFGSSGTNKKPFLKIILKSFWCHLRIPYLFIPLLFYSLWRIIPKGMREKYFLGGSRE